MTSALRLLMLVFALALALLFFLFLAKSKDASTVISPTATNQPQVAGQARLDPRLDSVGPRRPASQASSDFAGIAKDLAARLNDISPTPALGEFGWIAHRISFFAGDPKAYIEYTDTHIALRLLLQYDYQDGRLATKVLATFVPEEFGGWKLQYGQAAGRAPILRHFIFDGDSLQWIPELK